MSDDQLPERVLKTVLEVLKPQTAQTALHEPQICGREQEYVTHCLATGWVSSAGEFVERFEGVLREYTGAAHAIATVNGTAALHLALILAGVRAGDEVLVPSLTFIATVNAISYCGAVPHFIDSSPSTLGVDPKLAGEYLDVIAELRSGTCYNKLSGRAIRAIVPMHTFGHPVDLPGVMAIAENFKLALVEDAAESLGSRYRGRHAGRFGRVAALSFNGNKIVTTGGGGALLTDDDELGMRARHLSTTARVAHKWDFIHDEVGYNYRMPNINAALGCGQMERLEYFVDRKRKLAQSYADAFAASSDIQFFHEPPFCRSNYWLNALVLDRADLTLRNRILETLNGAGISARPVWTLMHRLAIYSACPRMQLTVAEDLAARIINIPSSARLAA